MPAGLCRSAASAGLLAYPLDKEWPMVVVGWAIALLCGLFIGFLFGKSASGWCVNCGRSVLAVARAHEIEGHDTVRRG